MKQMLLKVKYFSLLGYLLTYSNGLQAVYNETKRQQIVSGFSQTQQYILFLS